MFGSLRKNISRLIGVLLNISDRSPLSYNCRDYTSSGFVRKIIKLLIAPFYVVKYLILPFRESDNGREGLAFVLIAKNEAPYIEEWIHFHAKQGASHFIIYDNDSTDNLRSVLSPYIESGLVTYHTIKGKLRQNDAYNRALADYGKKFRYMAFIDTDEFLFLRINTDIGGGKIAEFLDEFMSEHPNAGGIAVNWCLFGSGGHVTKPEGGVLENYTMRSENDSPVNLHIKTICDPARVLYYENCHHPIYRRGFYNLDENGNIVEGAFNQKVSFEKIRINHYFTKSREEFIQKRNRGMADNMGLRFIEDFEIHDQNDVHDTEIFSRA